MKIRLIFLSVCKIHIPFLFLLYSKHYMLILIHLWWCTVLLDAWIWFTCDQKLLVKNRTLSAKRLNNVYLDSLSLISSRGYQRGYLREPPHWYGLHEPPEIKFLVETTPYVIVILRAYNRTWKHNLWNKSFAPDDSFRYDFSGLVVNPLVFPLEWNPFYSNRTVHAFKSKFVLIRHPRDEWRANLAKEK